MKIILLQNVPKLGQKGDIKEVNEGYARNMLIPQKKAKFATEIEVKRSIANKETIIQKQQEKSIAFSRTLEKISKKTFQINENTNEKGSLFAQVTPTEITRVINEFLSNEKWNGPRLTEKNIRLKEHIKEVGNHEIEIVGQDSNTKVFIEINSYKIK